MKVCPDCNRDIQDVATKCQYCHSDLPKPPDQTIQALTIQGSSRDSHPKRSTPTWITLAVLFAGGLLSLTCLFGVLLPSISSPIEASHRTQCRNNLKQIAWALHNYHDKHGSFPPAYFADEDGKPMHSWRVLILPFLEKQALYDAYDFSEPWNGPNNKQLIEKMPTVYACPSKKHLEPGIGITAYAAVTGEDCIFPGADSVAIRDITDGASQTIMLGEASHADITWTEPRDVNLDMYSGFGDSNRFTSHHQGGMFFSFADGRMKFINEDIDFVTFNALLTRNRGEVIGEF